MSKRNGDKARANRQQKRKVLNRKRNRGSGKLSKQAVASGPAQNQNGNNNVSSRLRLSTVNGQADPSALEIVVSRSRSGGKNA